MKAIINLLALFLVSSIIISCQKEPSSVKVSCVSLNTSSVSLDIGATCQLKATVSPSDATNKIVLWSTSSSSIATVDDNGLVVGVNAGSAVITARTDDGGMTATCAVNVLEKQVVVLDNTALSLKYGESARLTASLAPGASTPVTFVWQSSDTNVAMVNDGIVTAMGSGSATITATHGTSSATCDVTVTVETMMIKSILWNSYQPNGELTVSHLFKMSYDNQDRLRCIELDSDHNGIGHKTLLEYSTNNKANLIDIYSENDSYLGRRVLDMTLNETGAIDDAVNAFYTPYGVSYGYSNNRMTYRKKTYWNTEYHKDETTTALFEYTEGALDYMNVSANGTSRKAKFSYMSLLATEDVNSILISMMTYITAPDGFMTGEIAMNMINLFPGNPNLMKSWSMDSESHSISYKMDSGGHVGSMILEDDYVEFIFTYVKYGSQTYQYKEPFTFSGMGGTTWVYHHEYGDFYIVFLDGNKFYYVEDDGFGFQEMIAGTYIKNGSTISLSMGDKHLITTGTLSGNSIVTEGGYFGGDTYVKTSNFMF